MLATATVLMVMLMKRREKMGVQNSEDKDEELSLLEEADDKKKADVASV